MYTTRVWGHPEPEEDNGSSEVPAVGAESRTSPGCAGSSLVCQVPLQPLLPPQMSSLTQAHQKALASLTSKAEGLEKSLSSLEMKRAGETKQLAVAQKEVELLRSQLRSGAEVTGRGPAGGGMGASGLFH